MNFRIDYNICCNNLEISKTLGIMNLIAQILTLKKKIQFVINF